MRLVDKAEEFDEWIEAREAELHKLEAEVNSKSVRESYFQSKLSEIKNLQKEILTMRERAAKRPRGIKSASTSF
jgi:predicted RNase H-like nuclease (RuvC/YqgF family)